ncbi:hypothetical protein BZA05DRAFT_406545, partial [Tricharina praecox]|uniref:uncharacterized protein n=1 Tax=Tricharina praecox TaxID=43433 RepID=UPI002220BF01
MDLDDLLLDFFLSFYHRSTSSSSSSSSSCSYFPSDYHEDFHGVVLGWVSAVVVGRASGVCCGGVVVGWNRENAGMIVGLGLGLVGFLRLIL